MTNVNFDPARFQTYISDALNERDNMKKLYEDTCKANGKKPAKYDYSVATWTSDKNTLKDTEALMEEGLLIRKSSP